ncbi:MAG: CBS domain-containing protein [Anaerolineales bacterium]|nr:CBS domain-containing protein [Anaerolineales bacterium]
MIVSTVMKTRVITIPEAARLGDAVRSFVEHRVGTLPVLAPNGKLVGTLDMQDVLSLVMPPFVQLVSDFDFVHDFGPVEFAEMDDATRARPVTEIMTAPHAIEESSGLLRAYAYMRQHDLGNVLVTDSEGRLVGIASRVDVGVGFLCSWMDLQGHSG